MTCCSSSWRCSPNKLIWTSGLWQFITAVDCRLFLLFLPNYQRPTIDIDVRLLNTGWSNLQARLIFIEIHLHYHLQFNGNVHTYSHECTNGEAYCFKVYSEGEIFWSNFSWEILFNFQRLCRNILLYFVLLEMSALGFKLSPPTTQTRLWQFRH